MSLHMHKEATELLDEVLAKCGFDREDIPSSSFCKALAYVCRELELTYDAGFTSGLHAGRGGE